MSNIKSNEFKLSIYKRYVELAKRAKKEPIEQNRFFILMDKMYKVIWYKVNVLKEPEPSLAVEIDTEFTLYYEVNKGNLVVNIWDKMQAKYLLNLGGKQ
jgi:hypothetical protein